MEEDAIETARLACLAFTEADLKPPGSTLMGDFDVAEYRQQREYFERTLKTAE